MNDNGLTQAERLIELKDEHRDLDEAITALEKLANIDRLQVQRLKKRKLSLKEQIDFIEDELMPDIIA